MNGLLPSLGISPAGLLILWFILFIVLADIYCPLFNTCFACTTCHGRKGSGRWADD